MKDWFYGIMGVLVIGAYVILPSKMDSSSKVTSEATEEIVIIEDTIPTYKSLKVTVTCYQPLASQCNGNPLITADGSKIDLDKLENGDIKWVAASRDILSMFPQGQPKRIYIEGLGEFEVHDTMNKRWTNRIDILIHPNDTQRFCLKDIEIRLLDVV